MRCTPSSERLARADKQKWCAERQRKQLFPLAATHKLKGSIRRSHLRYYNEVVTMGMLRLLLLCSSLWTACQAYPTGAGWCIAGPAVGPPHLNAALVQTGTLNEYGYRVLVDGVAIDGETVLATKTEYTLSVDAPETVFRGVLLRLQQQTSSSSNTAAVGVIDLQPSTNTKTADVCAAPVVGVTHTDNSDKQLASGIVRVEDASTVSLDVTVVTVNNDQESIYSYSPFTLQFVDATDAPTPQPTEVTVPPTSSPTAAPVLTESPTPEPTATPQTASPTLVPTPVTSGPDPTSPPTTKNLSDAPSDVPSSSPSVAPVEPTLAPTIDVCRSEQDAYVTCYLSSSSTSNRVLQSAQPPCSNQYSAYQACVNLNENCEACVSASFPPTDSGCDDYTANICTALDECECECSNLLTEYIMCNLALAGLECEIECADDTTNSTTTTSPSAAPTESTSDSTAAESTTPCLSELLAFETCVDALVGSPRECEMCVAESFPALGSSCDTYNDEICGGLEECPCGRCGPLVYDYMKCLLTLVDFECSLDCDLASLSPTVSPTITPTSVPTITAAPTLDCSSCVQSLVTLDEIEACADLETQVCSAVDQCPCGDCDGEIVDLLACRLLEAGVNCTIDCTSPTLSPTVSPTTASPSAAPIVSPTPLPTSSPTEAPAIIPTRAPVSPTRSPTKRPTRVPTRRPTLAPTPGRPNFDTLCSREQESVEVCYEQESIDVDACDDCLVGSFPTGVPDCIELGRAICGAIDACPCGNCRLSIENYFSCAFQERIGCDLQC